MDVKAILMSRLIAIRESRKLTQMELGRRANLTGQAICHFEAGRRMPNLKNLIALCDALNISTDWLLGRCDFTMPMGPAVDGLLENWHKCSESDQEALIKFSRILAQKQGES